MKRILTAIVVVCLVPTLMGAGITLTQAQKLGQGRINEIGTWYKDVGGETLQMIEARAKNTATGQTNAIGAGVVGWDWSKEIMVTNGTWECYGRLYYKKPNDQTTYTADSNKINVTYP